MKHHVLEINVRSDNTAICWICSPAFGRPKMLVNNAIQIVTLKDEENRIVVAVTGREISIDDIKRIARQALTGNFEIWRGFRRGRARRHS